MRKHVKVVSLALIFALTAGVAQGADEVFRAHRPEPGEAIGAAFINVVFLPFRLAATTAVAVLGGFTGFMTGGDRRAAWDVFNLAGGDQIITPGMLNGRERFRFDSREVQAP